MCAVIRTVDVSHSPQQKVRATQGQKPVNYCRKKQATASQERIKATGQDATDPKQKAVTDYTEQVDRPPPPLFKAPLKQNIENQYNHKRHNNQENNQRTTIPGDSTLTHVTYLTPIAGTIV